MSMARNLNYLKRIWRHPCASPDVIVIIETAFEAAYPALLEVFGIGCTDIIKMRAGKSPWHSRKLRGALKHLRPGGNLGKNIYRFEVPYLATEAGLWWWMVIDAGTSFLPKWASLMYQEGSCDSPRTGYAEAELKLGPSFPGSDKTVQPQSVEINNCIRFNNLGVTIVTGCYATVTYELKLFFYDPAIWGVARCQVWLQDDEGHIGDIHDWNSTNDAGKLELGGGYEKIRTRRRGARTISVILRVLSGVVAVETGMLRVSAYGFPMPLVTGGCTPRPVTYPWGSSAPQPPGPTPIGP